jgi:hypothetical protein
VPEPALVLYRPGIGRRQHLTAADVLLVIEIADSTLSHALGYKADLYRRAKISGYWVVDVRHRCLRAFTLAADRYETVIVREGKVAPHALPRVEIDGLTCLPYHGSWNICQRVRRSLIKPG